MLPFPVIYHRRAIPPVIAEWPTTLLLLAILAGAVWLVMLILW